MSYHKAKDAFRENCNDYINSDQDPALYNLNVGLFQLTEALEEDLGRIGQALSEIKASLQRL